LTEGKGIPRKALGNHRLTGCEQNKNIETSTSPVSRMAIDEFREGDVPKGSPITVMSSIGNALVAFYGYRCGLAFPSGTRLIGCARKLASNVSLSS
jgi:hypothetical protein